MNLTKLKATSIVLVAVILLSSCSLNNNSIQTDSQNTQKISESKLFGGISGYQIDNPETYYDDEFKFSVEYPSTWKASKPNDELDTTTPDGSPERGVSISVDNKEFFKPEENIYLNSIYVYHAVGHIDFSQFEETLTKEVFTTTENVKGELSYVKKNGYLYIYLTLGEGAFYGAQIRISEDLFEKYKEQVYSILKSIKVTDHNNL